MIDEATPFYVRAWSIGWRVTLAWLLTFGSLLGLGSLLSALALRAAKRGPEGKGGEVQGVERTLRRLYRGVIWACCLFYYASMPLVLLAVLGVGGGLIYGFFAIGQIPVKLVAIIGLLTVSTVAAILKSLFVRSKDVDPGARLPLREHPELDAVLDEVAQKIGTRRVDTVYLTPGTELAVMERGSVMRRVRGQAERCLILGAGVFKGMKVLELKSVLAHECGHFRNEDTAGGGFALFVRRSLHTFILNLARAGAAAWYNPAWWFVRGFHRVFLIVSQGASRLQEVLADRWAVHAYGSAAFERGLTHVITRSVRFDAHIDATLNEVVKEKLPLRNLYAYKPGEVKDVESAVDEAINAEPSPYDSHPSPRDRVGWAHDLEVPPPPACPEDDRPVWSLFSSRKALERQMTDEIRQRVVNALGVKIPREEEESEEE